MNLTQHYLTQDRSTLNQVEKDRYWISIRRTHRWPTSKISASVPMLLTSDEGHACRQPYASIRFPWGWADLPAACLRFYIFWSRFLPDLDPERHMDCLELGCRICHRGVHDIYFDISFPLKLQYSSYIIFMRFKQLIRKVAWRALATHANTSIKATFALGLHSIRMRPGSKPCRTDGRLLCISLPFRRPTANIDMTSVPMLGSLHPSLASYCWSGRVILTGWMQKEGLRLPHPPCPSLSQSGGKSNRSRLWSPRKKPTGLHWCILHYNRPAPIPILFQQRETLKDLRKEVRGESIQKVSQASLFISFFSTLSPFLQTRIHPTTALHTSIFILSSGCIFLLRSSDTLE